jgi:CHAT domain-containing protein
VGQEDFSSIKNLIVIPDKILSYLPFEALIIHGKHNSGHPSDRILFEDYDISYAPSASSLISLRDRRAEGDAGDDLLLIGNPILDRPVNKIQGEKRGDDVFVEYYLGNSYILRPLQFASREMEFISRLMAPGTARIMSGSEATKDKIKQVSLGKYDVLHFATHSLLDEIVASRSALLLSKNPQSDEDGFLQVREIYNMKLNADLVVLSACQTARGKMEKGEGILGLCRAFLCSGARSVVASLWNVNDESTSQFMQKFYGFLTDGKTIQESLRLTKLYMCNSNKWRPCHWATFVLIGDGGNILRLHKSSFWSRLPHF